MNIYRLVACAIAIASVGIIPAAGRSNQTDLRFVGEEATGTQHTKTWVVDNPTKELRIYDDDTPANQVTDLNEVTFRMTYDSAEPIYRGLRIQLSWDMYNRVWDEQGVGDLTMLVNLRAVENESLYGAVAIGSDGRFDRVVFGGHRRDCGKEWNKKLVMIFPRACIQLRRIVTAASCTPARKFLASLS
jgi:hypothetical protein